MFIKAKEEYGEIFYVQIPEMAQMLHVEEDIAKKILFLANEFDNMFFEGKYLNFDNFTFSKEIISDEVSHNCFEKPMKFIAEAFDSEALPQYSSNNDFDDNFRAFTGWEILLPNNVNICCEMYHNKVKIYLEYGEPGSHMIDLDVTDMDKTISKIRMYLKLAEI